MIIAPSRSKDASVPVRHHGSRSFLLTGLLVAGAAACSEPSSNEGIEPAAPEPSTHATDKAPSLEIVDRAIAHHGGEALEQSRVSLRITSKSGSFRIAAEPGASYSYSVFSEDENGLPVEHHQSNRDGEQVARIVDGQAETLDEEQANRARNFVSERAYFPFLPYRLGDDGVWFEDLGLETWDGRGLHKVKVSFEPGTSSGAYQEYLYWFDPETAELAQFAYDFNNGLRLRRMFNTREIDGVLFQDARNYGQTGRDRSVDEIVPVDLDNDSDWKLVSTITLDQIEVEAR